MRWCYFTVLSVPSQIASLRKIVSGGQTGADRAALDVCRRYGFAHGGWCPQGRLAEDGPIDPVYNLTETPSASPLQRTQWNVRDSDATVVFSLSLDPQRGSFDTLASAVSLGKPFCHYRLRAEGRADPITVARLQHFLLENRVAVLNVAGSRSSEEPGLYGAVYATLKAALFAGAVCAPSASAVPAPGTWEQPGGTTRRTG